MDEGISVHQTAWGSCASTWNDDSSQSECLDGHRLGRKDARSFVNFAKNMTSSHSDIFIDFSEAFLPSAKGSRVTRSCWPVAKTWLDNADFFELSAMSCHCRCMNRFGVWRFACNWRVEGTCHINIIHVLVICLQQVNQISPKRTGMLCNSDNLQQPQSGVSKRIQSDPVWNLEQPETSALGKPSHIIQPGLPEIAQFNPWPPEHCWKWQYFKSDATSMRQHSPLWQPGDCQDRIHKHHPGQPGKMPTLCRKIKKTLASNMQVKSLLGVPSECWKGLELESGMYCVCFIRWQLRMKWVSPRWQLIPGPLICIVHSNNAWPWADWDRAVVGPSIK